jgi:cytochrome c-type biogenesis protein CcmH/NrfG
MKSGDVKMLDAAELTHLASRAIHDGQDERALELLQGAIARDPEDAKPLVMLGGMLASRQQMPQAIEAMTRAVTLDPQFAAARFQLGMMQFSCGNLFEATLAWQPLEELDATHPLRLFKNGMLHLASDEFDACIQALREGMARCQVASLNKEMSGIIDKVNALPSRTTQTSASQGAQHVLLAGYQTPVVSTKASECGP